MTKLTVEAHQADQESLATHWYLLQIFGVHEGSKWFVVGDEL